MNWSRRYAIRSYLRSTGWTAPVIALVLEQITFRIAYFHGIDFGGIPGFVIGRSGTIALAGYVISSSIAFIVFTFSSLIVAIQVASGQLSLELSRPLCSATVAFVGRLHCSSTRCF